MPDGPRGEYRRRRRSVRLLIVLTCLVVLVDVAAGVLTITSNRRSDSARATVTAGLAYDANMSSVLQATLDAETSQRGYLLTGDQSYLQPAKSAVKRAPALLKAIRTGSRHDPVLRRDYPKLLTLLEARLKDIVQTVDLNERGHHAQALAIVRTGRGNAHHAAGQDADRVDDQTLRRAGRAALAARRTAGRCGPTAPRSPPTWPRACCCWSW